MPCWQPTAPKESTPHARRSIHRKSKQFGSSADRNAAEQVLQIIIAPADSAAERERRVVENIVDTAGEEQHWRVRFLVPEDVLAVQAQVRIVIAMFAEIENLAGDVDAIVDVV